MGMRKKEKKKGKKRVVVVKKSESACKSLFFHSSLFSFFSVGDTDGWMNCLHSFHPLLPHLSI
jgi:hypothetical protein